MGGIGSSSDPMIRSRPSIITPNAIPGRAAPVPVEIQDDAAEPAGPLIARQV